jgi:hypothetical protein
MTTRRRRRKKNTTKPIKIFVHPEEEKEDDG